MTDGRDKQGIEKQLITTFEEILIALLDGEQKNNIIAARAGLTEQHLSRLLPRLVDHQLILSRFPGTRRMNRLTSKGRAIAELAQQKRRIIQEMKLDEKELFEAKLWKGRDLKRKW